MYTGIGAGNSRNGMPMVRQGNHHGINIVPCNNFFKIAIDCAILIIIIPINKILASFKMLLVNITNSNNLRNRRILGGTITNSNNP